MIFESLLAACLWVRQTEDIQRHMLQLQILAQVLADLCEHKLHGGKTKQAKGMAPEISENVAVRDLLDEATGAFRPVFKKWYDS